MNEHHQSDHSHEMSGRGGARADMQHGHGGGGEMDMSFEHRREMLEMHHARSLWNYWALIGLGAWMLVTPLTFDFSHGASAPSGGREVWLSLTARISAMRWNDVLSGLGLMIFGWRALRPNRPVSLWLCCGIGIWLNFAPLLFWCPSSLAYLNDTLIGSMAIAFSILIPGMPNMVMYMKMGGDIPPGWSYSPSSWPQRWIMIAPCFAGWLVSRYLAAYQLGFINEVWEPFFGNQSLDVLNSKMSHSWPISDAGLGAFSYTLEFLMGWMGSSSRWRTMPWMVAFFGVLVVPLGLTHILLVISQPVVVGSWCSMCLLAAIIMLPMIAVEIDEVTAMIQHLFDARRRGENLWQVFWFGGSAQGCSHSKDTPEMMALPVRPLEVLKAALWGTSSSWSLLGCAAIGVLLMFGPGIFGDTRTAADVVHLGGALIVVVAVLALTEVVRIGRWLNILLGGAVAALPWIVQGASVSSRLYSGLLGLAVVLLTPRLGAITQEYGMWRKWVR